MHHGCYKIIYDTGKYGPTIDPNKAVKIGLGVNFRIRLVTFSQRLMLFLQRENRERQKGHLTRHL